MLLGRMVIYFRSRPGLVIVEEGGLLQLVSKTVHRQSVHGCACILFLPEMQLEALFERPSDRLPTLVYLCCQMRRSGFACMWCIPCRPIRNVWTSYRLQLSNTELHGHTSFSSSFMERNCCLSDVATGLWSNGVHKICEAWLSCNHTQFITSLVICLHSF